MTTKATVGALIVLAFQIGTVELAAASSAIVVDKEVISLYREMKNNHIAKWATFKIINRNRIVVDKVGDREITESATEDKAEFEKMKQHLRNEGIACRYILYEFKFMTLLRQKKRKLAFIFICTDEASFQEKMLYSPSKDTFKKLFDGVHGYISVYKWRDMDYDRLVAKLEKKA